VRESLKGWLGLVLGPTIYATARGMLGARTSGRAQPKDIGAAEILRSGSSKTVLFGNTRVIVVRDRDEQLHAVSGICTHMGCSIRLVVNRSEDFLACNCHESRFNLRGENLNGPATKPLAMYQVDNVGGRLILTEAEERSRNH
jgi:Rieske Fe-S protein